MADSGTNYEESLAAARKLVAGARSVVSFSGAGLSVESGLSTFRDRATGLWARHDPMKLASVQGFEADPKLVIDWYNMRRRVLAEARPNAGHAALAGRREMVHVTQNVDDLLERAGAGNVLHVHGTLWHDRCHAGCGHIERIDLSEPEGLRTCARCGCPMRPAVVWFGEALPEDIWRQAEDAVRGCEVLLVVGTSARVYPAAGLIPLAQSRGAGVIIVNTEADGVHAGSGPMLLLEGPAARVLPALLTGRR